MAVLGEDATLTLGTVVDAFVFSAVCAEAGGVEGVAEVDDIGTAFDARLVG